MKRWLLGVGLLLANLANAHAEMLLNETFSYSNGSLTATSSGAWNAHSGAASSPVQVASNAIVLAQGAGTREDVNRTLGRTMAAGNIWRFELDITVNGTANATDVYFAHLKDTGTGFNARAFVAAPVAGGNFTFGISDTLGNPDSKFATDFNYGTTYRLFSEYNFDTGISSMWINDPSIKISSTTADIGQAMNSIAFRQAGGNTSMVIDNLVVTAVPEPSSIALLSLVGIGGFALRRLRKGRTGS